VFHYADLIKAKINFYLGAFLLAAASVQPALGDEISKTPPDTEKPVQIRTSVLLINLREIDGANQTFSADVGIRLRWKDPRLASEQKIRFFPLTSIWHPDAQLVNRVNVQTPLPETVSVDSEGNVVYRQRYIGQFSCKMDLKEFPLDQQTLPIRVVATAFSPSEVRFVKDRENGITDQLSITDWDVLSWNARETPLEPAPGAQPFSGYTFELKVRRYFYFFLIQIIIPMALILGMSWIVFWLDPKDAGPRISISVTTMLTIVAYRLLISNFLPRLSFLTRMDFFVFGCTLLIFLTLICVVVINRLIRTQYEKTGIRIDKYSRSIFPILFAILAIYCFLL
jgi:Neurotransmitter-gated ion-channel ligand binding domain/Neurotransmitter-gated ion-channel transmembrane region